MFRRLAYLLILVPPPSGGFALEPAGDDRQYAEIVAGLQARHERVQSFEVEWSESLTDFTSNPPGQRTVAGRLVGAGEFLRYSRNGPAPHLSKIHEFAERSYVFVVRPDDARTLFDGPDHGAHPAGWVNCSPRARLMDDYTMQGALLALRPLSAHVGGIDPAQYSLSPERGSIDGVSCYILQTQVNATATRRLWISADGDYRVLRQDAVRPTYPIYELTIHYAAASDDGVRPPSEWTTVVFSRNMVLNRNDVQEVYRSRVAEFALNRPAAPAEFELEFEPGTIVQDEVTLGIGIVREDGRLRTVPKGELMAGMTWEQLMATDPPPEALPFIKAPADRNWLWIPAGACVLAGLLIWRRRQARRAAP